MFGNDEDTEKVLLQDLQGNERANTHSTFKVMRNEPHSGIIKAMTEVLHNIISIVTEVPHNSTSRVITEEPYGRISEIMREALHIRTPKKIKRYYTARIPRFERSTR